MLTDFSPVIRLHHHFLCLPWSCAEPQAFLKFLRQTSTTNCSTRVDGDRDSFLRSHSSFGGTSFVVSPTGSSRMMLWGLRLQTYWTLVQYGQLTCCDRARSGVVSYLTDELVDQWTSRFSPAAIRRQQPSWCVGAYGSSLKPDLLGTRCRTT